MTETIICPQCGSSVNKAAFCRKCGFKFGDSGAANDSKPVHSATSTKPDITAEEEDATVLLFDVKASPSNGGTPIPQTSGFIHVQIPDQASSKKTSKCLYCGAELEENARFCLECGEAVVTLKKEEAVQSEATVICPQCGSNGNKAKFCRKCGYQFKDTVAPLPEEQSKPPEPPKDKFVMAPTVDDGMVMCPGCGATVKKTKFCRKCGYQFGEANVAGETPKENNVMTEAPAAEATPAVAPEPLTIAPEPLTIAPEPQTAPAPTVDDGMVMCPECGATVNKAKFCRKCGYQFEEPDIAAVEEPDIAAVEEPDIAAVEESEGPSNISVEEVEDAIEEGENAVYLNDEAELDTEDEIIDETIDDIEDEAEGEEETVFLFGATAAPAVAEPIVESLPEELPVVEMTEAINKPASNINIEKMYRDLDPENNEDINTAPKKKRNRVMAYIGAAVLLIVLGSLIGTQVNKHMFNSIPQETDTAASYKIQYEPAPFSDENKVNTYPNSYSSNDSDIILPTPAKTGYEFQGWFTSPEYSADSKVSGAAIKSGSKGDITFYAKWVQAPIQYTITYELNGGTNDTSNPQSYTASGAGITLAAPTREGFVFKGWFRTPDFSDASNVGNVTIPSGSTGNQTFYAKWESPQAAPVSKKPKNSSGDNQIVITVD